MRLLPTETSTMTHDAIVHALRAVATKVDLQVAAAAFLASLGSAPKRFRTPLFRAAYAANFPSHAFTPSAGEQSYLCAICGMSKSEVLDHVAQRAWREKGDTGGASATAALLDLEDFVANPTPTPGASDVACFDRMLEAIAGLPAEGRATDLTKLWAKVVPRTNAYSRASLVATLGACGLLETLDHPGHLTRWVGFWEYEEVPQLNGDMRPPAAWWRGADGVARAALDELFPQEGIMRTRFEGRRRVRSLDPGPSVVPRAKGAPKGSTALELARGDLLGIAFAGRHMAAVVVGRHLEGERAIPVVEFFDQTWASKPSPREIGEASARLVGPHRAAPDWRREPLALDGMELFGTVMDVQLERLARDHGLPNAKDLPLPDYGYRVVAPRNLLYLLAGIVGGGH
jgi:hypothetical protein